MPFDTASDQWAAGLRRLEAAPPDQRPVLERVTRQIEASCAAASAARSPPRSSPSSTTQDTGWTSDLAYALAPEQPYAWDVRVVGDAAFARYLREATDYAGGRRTTPRPGASA